MGWNMYDPDNQCDAASSVVAPVEDADADMYDCQRSDCYIPCERQTTLPEYQRQTVRAIAVIMTKTTGFLRD